MLFKLNFKFFIITIFISFISVFFISCNNQNFTNGIVTFDNNQYTAAKDFQINNSYFDDARKPKNQYFTPIAKINKSIVYSIKGLDVKDWIYFDYADCDVGFYLSKNINTQLNDEYFNFSDKFELIKYEYSIEHGLRNAIDTIIENKNVVSFAYKTALEEGHSDMGVTSDKLTCYSLLLMPENYPALQYNVGYYEYKDNYFIGSNKNGLNTQIDGLIHEIINGL